MNVSDSQAIELAMAYVFGCVAGGQRLMFSENPYVPGSDERKEWMRGWREAVARQITGKGQP